MAKGDSVAIDRPYTTERLWLPFLKGPAFYWS